MFIPRSNSSGYYDIDKESVRATADSGYFISYPLLGDVPNVAVPTHFFKVILVSTGSDGGYSLGAFVLPNESIDSKAPLTDFQVKLDSVERVSGLQFFSELDRSSFGDLCSTDSCKLQ